MNDNKNQSRSRNVTAKDIITALVVIGLMLPLAWLKENGEQWASYLFALIPIMALSYYWLKVPAEKQEQADIKVKDELNKSILGRGFKYFTWLIYGYVCFIIIKLISGWVQSA